MLVDACVAPTPCIGHGGTARKNPLLDINQSPISGARTRPAKERCITTKGMIGTQARPDIGLLSLVGGTTAVITVSRNRTSTTHAVDGQRAEQAGIMSASRISAVTGYS
jgi:hypothetical protein